MFEPIPPASLLKIYKGCSNCRTQKIKCNGQEPCSRCRAFGLQCQYIVLPNQAAHRLAALAAGGGAGGAWAGAGAGVGAGGGVNTLNNNPAPPSATSPIASPFPSATAARVIPPPISTSSGEAMLSATISPTPSPTTPIATNSTTNTITPCSTDDSITPGPRITSSAYSPNSQTSRKKRRSAGSSRKKSDGSRPESTNSPIAKSLSPAEFSPRSPESTAETSTAPNVIMQLLMDAADPDLYAYKGPHESDDISPSPDVLRELVGFYIQYMHPIHGLVDPKASDFWTRLDHPMEPKIAAVVYAMCTIGAIFKSSTPIPGAKPPTPHPGVRDDLVFEFYRRTWTLKDERPRDIVTIQTILMMQSFFDLTSQVEEAASSCRLMAEIADEIGLGAHVLEMGHREKLSMEDILVRNTWKLLVWSEVMGFLISKKSSKITPTKNLSSKALNVRPEEVPDSKTPIAQVVHYHLGNLFKIFQLIARIKLPMSPRDLHAVTNVLDEFTTWYSSLPKHLRGSGSRSTFASGQGTTLPSAYTLDLYFRLGHILLLNSLPSTVRSSPTGLGPRRESPLRILATCANGITATVSDLTKEPELRNYCMANGLRCLTEAATLQLANSKELDPNISTPAKLNFMKTLWCIRQFNFALPQDVLNLTLAPYDSVGKTPSSSSTQDVDQMDSTKEVFRPRTSSVSSVAMESPVFSAPQRTKRDISLVSDYSSSTVSAREGSHPTIYETDEPDPKRGSRTAPVSPLQDNAAASLLALSLESPTTAQSLAATAMAYCSAQDVPLEAVNASTNQVHPPSRDEYEGDWSRSSSISVLSLRESPKTNFTTDTQSYPVPSQRTSYPSPARREPLDAHSLHVQDYRPPADTHPHPLSPRQMRATIYRPLPHRTSALPISEGAWASPDNRHNRHRRSSGGDGGYPPRVQNASRPSSTAASTQEADMTGTDLHRAGRALYYERDSAIVSDQQRPPNFPSPSSTLSAPSMGGPSHSRVLVTGSSRSLLASERQGTGSHHSRYDLSQQLEVSNEKVKLESNRRPDPDPRAMHFDQRNSTEMPPPRGIQSYGSSTGRGMDTYRTHHQLSEHQDQALRSHSHRNSPSRHSVSTIDGEQKPRDLYLTEKHADGYFSTGTVTMAHSNPEHASKPSTQRASNFPVDRRRELSHGFQDPPQSLSYRHGSGSALVSIESEPHIEDQARLGQLHQPHQQQQQLHLKQQIPLHRRHPYHRRSTDENIINRSSVPARGSIEQPSRSADGSKIGSLEQESPQSAGSSSSPSWSFSPLSAAAAVAAGAAGANRPIAMPSSRSSSRRSSAAVLWHESPHLWESLSHDRGAGSSSEEPILRQERRVSASSEGRTESMPLLPSVSFAGRKRPSVSMYSAGDEEGALRNRGSGISADSGQLPLQGASDSRAMGSGGASHRSTAYSLDPLHQDGQGSSRPLESRQSGSTRNLERQEQGGVGLGLSGITPPTRYAQPEFARDHQHYPVSEHALSMEYHHQYRPEHVPQGKSSDRHSYPLHRPIHSPHSQQDPRLFHSQGQVYDPAAVTHSHHRQHHQQQRSMGPPHSHPHSLGPVQATYLQTTASIPHPQPLGPPTHTRSDGAKSGGTLEEDDNDSTSGYSDLERDPVRRKYR